MFIVSVIVWSNCHILEFLHQMFNVSTLLLDDALKQATPLIAPLVSGVAGLSRSDLYDWGLHKMGDHVPFRSSLSSMAGNCCSQPMYQILNLYEISTKTGKAMHNLENAVI